ncbi:Protein of unknown function DUF4229 like protein, partial [Aduncisulcus paluster]
QKVPLETPATVRHLLRDANSIQRYSDVRSYTSQGPSRLEVLASESDPAVSEAFSAEDYSRTLEILERFYSVVLTDCGTGLMHSAMSSVLEQADTLVVISSGSVDGARKLVRRSVAVINAVRPRSGKVDMQKVVDHFSRRCRAVRLVPFDPHLEEGAEISLDRLRPPTRRALIELAAVVAQGFTVFGRIVPADAPEKFGIVVGAGHASLRTDQRAEYDRDEHDFPLAIAILFALIIALPLGMAVFAPLRRRVTASIAVVDERRRADRADLQARLRGEKPKDS